MIYFAFLACGLTLGIIIGGLNAEKKAIPFRDTLCFVLAAVLAGVAGARLFHVLFEGMLLYYLEHPFYALSPWNGGLSIWGGLLGALAAFFLVFRERFTELVRLTDCFAPAFLFGLALTRIGCFFQGCCYGVPTDLPWAATYRAGSHAFLMQLHLGLIDESSATSLPVHPAQLYESSAALLAGLFLQYKAKKLSPGTPVLLALLMYSGIRFVIEFFRADNRGFAGGIPIPQIVAAALLVLFSAVLLYRRYSVRTKNHQGENE